METKLSFDDKSIILSLCLSIVICIGNFFQFYQIVSISFRLLFVVTVIMFVHKLLRNKAVSNMVLMIIFTSILAFVFVWWNCKTSISIGYLSKYLSFVSTLLFFYLTTYTQETSSKLLNIIMILYSLLSAFYFYAFFLCSNDSLKYYTTIYYSSTFRYLTFGFGNPNQTSLFMSCLSMYGVLFFIIARGKKYNILFLIISFMYLYYSYLTLSRNGVISFALFVALTLYFVLGKRNIPKWLLFTLALYPFLFVGLYMLVLKNQYIIEHLQFLVSDGKGLNSRIGVFEFGIKCVKHSPIIGSYWENINDNVFQHVHNSHLDVLVSYGVIVFLITMVLLIRTVFDTNKNARNAEGKTALLCFLACIITGAGESALFSGGTGYHIFVGCFLFIVNLANKNTEKDEVAKDNDIRVGNCISLKRGSKE